MTPLFQPPHAARKPKTMSLFGVDRQDPYYWLNQREDPEVLDYLNQENAYLDSVMAPYTDLRKQLYAEMIARLKPDETSVPYQRGDYFYYRRFEPGKEYPVFCRMKAMTSAPEEILLNGNLMAEESDYFEIGSLSVSADQNLLAYTVDTVGRRIYQIKFKNLTTGETLPQLIDHVDPSLAWAADNQTLFYVRTDPETLRSSQIYRHRLGQEPGEDTLIYAETDDAFQLNVYHTHSRKFIVILAISTMSTEGRVLAASEPEGEFQLVAARAANHRYFLDHFGDELYILSNKSAINHKILKTKAGQLDEAHWQVVVPHRPEVLIEEYHQFAAYLVVLERENGQQSIRVIPKNGEPGHKITFDQAVYSLSLNRNYVFETDTLRFDFESLATPHSVFDYHMVTRQRVLLKQEEVIGDFDSDNYITKRMMAPARDGVAVPISMVYRKGLHMDGSHPLLLYGYGAYGIKIDPSFRAARLSLLDRGFIFAIAHVRGGADLGRQWYEDGKTHRKKNTFNDFVDCGQFLVEGGFTQPERLFAIGGSAGGMLMGVIANQSPRLFKGIIANVPFVDCVTTMLDTSIPLTTGEFDEWGNPAIEEDFSYILDYSPYDNVTAKDYPHLLVIAGLHDSQVQYWEPAKWVAKLRYCKTDDHWLLLRTQMEAGHSGAPGRFGRFEEEALIQSFLLALAGFAEKG